MSDFTRILFIQFSSPPMNIVHLSPGLLAVMDFVSKMKHTRILFRTISWENLTTNSLINTIQEAEAKVIAIPVYSDGYERIERSIRHLIAKNQNISVVVGGPHIEAVGNSFLKDLDRIYRCVQPFSHHVGNIFSEAIEKVAERKPIPVNEPGINHRIGENQIRYNVLEELNNNEWENYRPVIITSLGCKYKCSFCSEGSKGDRIVFRKKESIENELNWIGSNMNSKYIMIADDNVLSSRIQANYLLEILGNTLEAYPGMHFFVLSRPEDIIKNKDVVEDFSAMNIIRVQIGIESGCRNMRRRLGKYVTNQTIKDAVACLYQAHIPFIVGSFILGGPDENESSFLKTCLLVKELMELAPGVFEPAFSFLRPYPGTTVLSRFKDGIKPIKGIRIGNTINDRPILTTPALSEQKLFELRNNLLSLVRKTIITNSDKIKFNYWKKKFFLEEQFQFESIWTRIYIEAPNCRSALIMSNKSSLFDLERLSYEEALECRPICTIHVPPSAYISGITIPFGRSKLIEISPELSIFLSLCNGERTLEQVLDDFEVRCSAKINNVPLLLLDCLKYLGHGQLLLWGTQ